MLLQHARAEGSHRRIAAAMQNVGAQGQIIDDVIARVVVGGSMGAISDLKHVLDLLLSVLDNVSGLFAGKDRRCKDAITEAREYLELHYFVDKGPITAARVHALMTDFRDRVDRLQGSEHMEDRFRQLEWWDFCQFVLSKCSGVMRIISTELDGEWEVRDELLRDISRALDCHIPLRADDRSPLMLSPVPSVTSSDGSADSSPPLLDRGPGAPGDCFRSPSLD